MTNQEQYDKICENANKVSKMEEEIKDLGFRLDRTTKQRNALMIALNYINKTMISVKWGGDASPEYMGRIVKNALLMAVDKSKGTIKLNAEVEYDD